MTRNVNLIVRLLMTDYNRKRLSVNMICFRILPKKRTLRENVDHMWIICPLKRHNFTRKILKKVKKKHFTVLLFIMLI